MAFSLPMAPLSRSPARIAAVGIPGGSLGTLAHPSAPRPAVARGRCARGHAAWHATPAADVTLSEAARLAGSQPVGSHHLLLAALADPDTAAARALAALGVDLEQAKAALHSMDITGTSDEPPEEAGRRQMVIHVTGERLTIEATDPVIIEAGRAALHALGDQASPPGTIRGDLPACASLSTPWQARRATGRDRLRPAARRRPARRE